VGEAPVPETPPSGEQEGKIPSTSAQSQGPSSGWRLMLMALGALGIVYGDIGTSPLYAFRECFSEQYGIPVNEANVLGLLSLIFWSLVIVVSIKYLTLVMRADNHGEGGILALMALAREDAPRREHASAMLIIIGLFGAALLYGDGMITPAISVLSAVEGLGVAAKGLQGYVMPITVVIVVALFLLQKRGTARVGAIFGPITLTWFIVIGLLGLIQVVQTPRILLAMLPNHVAGFVWHNQWRAFFVLGAVFLVVTGGEALYADIGHFGKRPIRLAWFAVALPALLLSYFGQGALLLHEPAVAVNPFYHMAPDWALYPLVALATAATVIASQAVISGSFSLTRQAVYLGYLPRMEIHHTSGEEVGQVYIGLVNWVFCLCTITLIIGFRSSSALAGAYGVSVSVTMVITSVLLFLVMRDLWGWGSWIAGGVSAGLLLVDLSFFGANINKVPSGGWIPLVVAVIVYIVMSTWNQGRQLIRRRLLSQNIPIEKFLDGLRFDSLKRAEGAAIFLSSDPEGTPISLINNLKHNQILHEKNLLFTINTLNMPYVPPRNRLQVQEIGHGFWRVQTHYGFMQPPRAPQLLRQLRNEGLDIDIERATFFLSRMVPVPISKSGMARWRELLFTIMSRNSQNVSTYFGIPSDRVVEIGFLIDI
jgi:KUP system potassium uptake protein